MKASIDLLDHPRVELGWIYLNTLIESLAKSQSKVELVYLFESKELILTDPSIIEVLNNLKIPYKESRPENSLRFLLVK